MIVEKDGFVVVYTQDGKVSLHDWRGQRIFCKSVEKMTKEKALEIIADFSKKGIIATC